jgi:hypothetical protein
MQPATLVELQTQSIARTDFNICVMFLTALSTLCEGAKIFLYGCGNDHTCSKACKLNTVVPTARCMPTVGRSFQYKCGSCCGTGSNKEE